MILDVKIADPASLVPLYPDSVNISELCPSSLSSYFLCFLSTLNSVFTSLKM